MITDKDQRSVFKSYQNTFEYGSDCCEDGQRNQAALPRAEEGALPRPPKADALLRGCKKMRAGGETGDMEKGGRG